MKASIRLFAGLTAFFLFIGTVYGIFTHGEAVGMGALLLSGGLAAMIGFYLAIVDRRSGQMPEDDPHGEIADAAGEVGTFAPWSWWPLVLAGSAAMAFLALAVGWWLLAPAVVLGAIGLVGWVFEFSRGQHAH
jgi:hypothetical protein